VTGNNTEDSKRPLVSVAAPSLKLLDKMAGTMAALDQLGVPYTVSIVAAHRAPSKTLRYITDLDSQHIEVVIACGAGSAHLPGMIASLTTIPVIGVPLRGESLDGMDSLLSMVQMPPGVPVGTVGIESAYNAGILACRILSVKYPHLKERLCEHKKNLEEQVEKEDKQRTKSKLDAYGR
jgi:5-(carboxyamino)imidazole ribonucleotide mutase